MPVCSSSNEDYVEILNKLKALRIIHNPDYLVIGGDFNVDLNKHSSLQGILQDFSCEQSLKSCHDFNTCDIKYTFESKCNSAKSFIDYFMCNFLETQGLECKSLNEGDNLSDHLPDKFVVDLPVTYQKESDVIDDHSKVLWSKASDNDIQNYQYLIDRSLIKTDIPWNAFCCSGRNCSDHAQELENFYNNIIELCLSSSDRAIPCSQKRQNVIVGGSELVEPARNECMSWHNLWKANGSPRNGIVYNIKVKTRAKYHYTLRNVKAIKEVIISEKVAQSLLENQSSKFWF